MAKNLKVTAEGVEAEAQMAFLRTLLAANQGTVIERCDRNQPGWGLNQPYR
jgi:EAL domain-containing protein (putative c-di-GMP-specific phosphodiesterase class I)